MIALRCIGTALMSTLFLTSCASSAPPKPLQSGASSSAPSASPTVPSPVLPAEGEANAQAPGSNPVWADGDRATAIEAADVVMRAFAQPALEQNAWFDQLSVHLTPAAQLAYSTVPNDQIPATSAQASCELSASDTPFLASAACPTDAGIYTVLLQREDGDSPWLTARITPPGEAK